MWASPRWAIRWMSRSSGDPQGGRAAARGRLRGRWRDRGSAPAGAARATPAPAAGPRRTSGAATAAAGRASPTASGAHPTIRSGGRAPGDGWRSGRSRPMWRVTAGPARAGIGQPTRSGPASSQPTIRCRSSSVASRCRLGRAYSARAATPARGSVSGGGDADTPSPRKREAGSARRPTAVGRDDGAVHVDRLVRGEPRDERRELVRLGEATAGTVDRGKPLRERECQPHDGGRHCRSN